jgi:hypothetical protein
MRFLSVDDYLADLNVLVDQLGAVDLVDYVRRLDVVALCARFRRRSASWCWQAPIDIAAAPSGLSALVDASPLAMFLELVKLGDGRILGHKILRFWGPQTLESSDVHQLLQTPEPIESSAFANLDATFRDWYAWTVDLPGNYYLEVVDRLYKCNGLATCQFVALGQTIDLAKAGSNIPWRRATMNSSRRAVVRH